MKKKYRQGPTGVLESMTSHHTLVDGAGPSEPMPVPVKRRYTKDELKGDVQYLSQRVTTWLLDGDRLERLLAQASLKDVMVTLGITTEKLLLLEGAPTQIVSAQQHQTIDAVMPALLQEMQRRGVTTEVRERTITMTQPEEGMP